MSINYYDHYSASRLKKHYELMQYFSNFWHSFLQFYNFFDFRNIKIHTILVRQTSLDSLFQDLRINACLQKLHSSERLQLIVFAYIYNYLLFLTTYFYVFVYTINNITLAITNTFVQIVCTIKTVFSVFVNVEQFMI